MSMARYDEDIQNNPYLNEHGKYVAQFARNHGISTAEAFEHPTVKAHEVAINQLVYGFRRVEKGE